MALFRLALVTAVTVIAAGCPGDNDDGYVAPPPDAEGILAVNAAAAGLAGPAPKDAGFETVERVP